MTATGELRRLLKERGVEWDASDTYRLLVTSWKDAIGHNWAFMEHRDGSFSKLTAYHLTPEQAIAATLGRGECHDKNGFDPELGFECTVCGAMVDSYMVTPMEMGHVRQFAYCPFCGRRVKLVDGC